MPVKNFCFRAYAPTRNAEAVDEALFRAHRYRNQLCELELKRRANLNDLINQLAPDYVAAAQAVEAQEAKCEEITATIKKRSQKAQKRVPATAEEKAELKQARELLKELRKTARELKKDAYARPAVVEQTKLIQEAHQAAHREARGNSGIYWGTYLFVEDSAKTFSKGPPPRFASWRGEGTIGVQLQGGMLLEDAINGKSRIFQLLLDKTPARDKIRLEKGKDGKMRPRPPRSRRREYYPRGKARIRIGSTEGREPIFAEFPIRWTRDLPAGTKIKWAYVSRRKVATQVYWELRITAEVPHATRQPLADCVAVHVGWRKLSGGGLRVAMWRGSDGETGELIIPHRRLTSRDKCSSLQSIRDTKYEKVKRVVAKWVDRAARRGQEVPEFLKEARQHMLQWRSIERMHKLLEKWRHERFDGDRVIFEFLHGRMDVKNDGWRKWDKHLWLWEAHQRQNLRLWRTDLYRVFAKRLAEKYGFVGLMQCDWASLTTRPDAVETADTTNAMRANASVAAVSTLERFLVEAFGPDCVVKTDSAYLTATCHSCQSKQDVKGNIRHQCRSCGVTWDLDKNASRNQLARTVEAIEEMPSIQEIMQARIADNDNTEKTSVVSARQQLFRKNKQGKSKEATAEGGKKKERQEKGEKIA